jgi:ribosomal protein S18 acetylase RimI-like enzyme
MPESVHLDAAALERLLIDALDVMPNAKLTVEDDWVQLTTPGSKQAHHNVVMRARLAPSDVDARIAAVKREYAALGVGFRWVVGPSSEPDDQSERLIAAGIPLVAPAYGMVMEVPETRPSPGPGIELRPATLDDVEALGDVAARGWGRSADFGQALGEVVQRTLSLEDPDVSFFLGYLDGELVGVATLRLLPYAGYLLGASVIPEARGRGLYRAMTWHRLGVIADRGLRQAVIWANVDTSAQIAERMGFRRVCDGAFHELHDSAGS